MACFQLEKKRSPPQGGGRDNEGASVSRRPSRRQQEKAPEGRPPHVNGHGQHHADEEGPAPDIPGGDSKFQEQL